MQAPRTTNEAFEALKNCKKWSKAAKHVSKEAEIISHNKIVIHFTTLWPYFDDILLHESSQSMVKLKIVFYKKGWEMGKCVFVMCVCNSYVADQEKHFLFPSPLRMKGKISLLLPF